MLTFDSVHHAVLTDVDAAIVLSASIQWPTAVGGRIVQQSQHGCNDLLVLPGMEHLDDAPGLTRQR